MFIFSSELAIILYCIFAFVFFTALQLLLCCKLKNTLLKLLPSCLAGLGWIFILCLMFGLFGNSKGFFGNVHQLTAIILGLILAPGTLGIATAWLTRIIVDRKSKTRK